MNIIILALARWDGPYSSTAFSLAKEFAKNHTVFYIENPLTLKYVIKNALKNEVRKRLSALFFLKKKYKKLDIATSELTIVTPPVVLPVNFLPKGKLYNRLSAFNDIVFGKALIRLINDYSMSDYIYINIFNPFYTRKVQLLFKPKLFIYMTVDDIANSAYISKHGPYLETEMIGNADVVLCTSRELKKLKEKTSKHVYLLPNAADINLFKESQNPNLNKPSDIKNILKPIVVYTGNIDKRVDLDLLESLLQSCTEYCFLLIGPISIDNESWKKLASYPNILFTGKKLLTDLPAYLKFASCAIIPFKCNTLTKSIYPLKINEYLAAGNHVVSTAFSEDIQDFKEVIHLANDAIGFSNAIKLSIENDLISNDGQRDKRIRFVEKNSWEERANLFWQIISPYISLK